MQLLLDTCAAIWIAADAPLSEAALKALSDAEDEGLSVLVSPITAWETGLLVARGRIALPTDVKTWFDRLMQAPSVKLCDLSPAELIDSSFLPGSPRRDPSDRILIATARRHNLTLVTRDKAILEYAAEGHVRALAC